MVEAELGGGREETPAAAAVSGGAGSLPGSPKNKVKFMCSHGGIILPRAADGHLKYIGGETRIVGVPRDINFAELMKRLQSLANGDIILKYQLIPEDLDTLVTMKSNDDLRHMIDEHDRYESTGNPMLRAFLFPANPVVLENHINPIEPHALEQRYIDAVNGVIRATAAAGRHLAAPGNHSPTGLSTASSSPKSPQSCNMDSAKLETKTPNDLQSSRLHMNRVHSSPSVSSLSSHHHSTTTSVVHHHHHHHHQPNQYQQNYQHHGYPSPISPIAQTPERLVSVRSVGRDDSWKYQLFPTPGSYYPTPMARQNSSNQRASCSYSNRCIQSDEYGAYVNISLDRGERLYRSPPP